MRVHYGVLYVSGADNMNTGIAAKVENKGQYDEYLKELEPLREELGVVLKETMYPDGMPTVGGFNRAGSS